MSQNAREWYVERSCVHTFIWPYMTLLPTCVTQITLARAKVRQEHTAKQAAAMELKSQQQEGLTFENGVAVAYQRWKPSPELKATLHAHKSQVSIVAINYVEAHVTVQYWHHAYVFAIYERVYCLVMSSKPPCMHTSPRSVL